MRTQYPTIGVNKATPLFQLDHIISIKGRIIFCGCNIMGMQEVIGTMKNSPKERGN
jgi:hypothetical protein